MATAFRAHGRIFGGCGSPGWYNGLRFESGPLQDNASRPARSPGWRAALIRHPGPAMRGQADRFQPIGDHQSHDGPQRSLSYRVRQDGEPSPAAARQQAAQRRHCRLAQGRGRIAGRPVWRHRGARAHRPGRAQGGVAHADRPALGLSALLRLVGDHRQHRRAADRQRPAEPAGPGLHRGAGARRHCAATSLRCARPCA